MEVGKSKPRSISQVLPRRISLVANETEYVHCVISIIHNERYQVV